MTTQDRIRQTRQGSIGWLVQRIANRFEQRMTEALQPQGLTLAQFAILMRVLEHPDQSQTDLGAAYAMPAWTISRALDGLERAGLITRSRCLLSRRTQRIRATLAAETRLADLQTLVAKVNEAELAPLPPDDRAALQALLSRLAGPD